MLLALKAMVGAFAWRCVCANSRRQPEHTSPPPPLAPVRLLTQCRPPLKSKQPTLSSSWRSQPCASPASPMPSTVSTTPLPCARFSGSC
jgi:hypothetical protein